MERHSLTLYELNSLVRETIETTFCRAYWVEAELSEAREVRGHCYLELIQKDLFSATPVARASAKCWKSNWYRLRPKFESATGQQLHAGMKVLLLVSANFHEAYGFSWIVQDIDPTYTLGDMARKRLEIIRQLKAEGVFDLQKELSIPMFAQRVAVISSENAAGYGDFCNQLHNNDYGFTFTTELFPAIMQGEQVEATVINALNDIFSHQDDFDVVVIIRGGGATADMSGFDTLALAENVANFPLPIITGIGHDRDESVLDMISYLPVKTPTAAAAFLTDHLSEVYNRVQEAQERIVYHTEQRLRTERMRIDRLSADITRLFSVVKTRQEAYIDRCLIRLAASIRQRLADGSMRVERMESRLRPLVQQKLTAEHHRLQLLRQRAQSQDPDLLLKRGYSITLCKGKSVKDATKLSPGDIITTRLASGSVTSEVVKPTDK